MSEALVEVLDPNLLGSRVGPRVFGSKWTRDDLYCKNIQASSLSDTRLCSPFGLEMMVKLRTFLMAFTFISKAKARDYGKGCYISNSIFVIGIISVVQMSVHLYLWNSSLFCILLNSSFAQTE